MPTHDKKVARIVEQLKNRKSTSPVSLKKKTISHEVPKPNDKRHTDEKIDVSDLNEVLHVDPKKKICIAEPGVTFVDLVKATMKHNLVPIVVPELKTITIGGAVAGCSIESMSFKNGGFHDNCIEYEVITATGEVLTCTPDNENKLTFQMVHGTFGTLGIISKLTFNLVPAKKFVKVEYEKYNNIEDYKKAIWRRFENKDVDFMDGIIHSPTEYVLSIANFVDEAPYTHNYDWMLVYFRSTSTRKEDYLTTPDYFFRYDKGVTNVTPSSFLGRLMLGKFIGSTELLQLTKRLRKIIPTDKIPFTLDVFIPFSKATDFLEWYEKKINFYPLWCVPYKIRKYEWLNDDFAKRIKDELFLDIAIYGLQQKKERNFHKMMEEKLFEIGGIKTLISCNHYTEPKFWRIWNKPNFQAVKKKTDPKNIFRDLYTKTCRTMMGLEDKVKK